MKIHDKFVIELQEVIKGYGNDPTVQDPFKFPCYYKFYEIEGVAICEKSFEKMNRLEDEINAVLDEIRAEITNIPITDTDGHNNNWYREPQAIINDVLRIIDKYREGNKE